MTERAHARDTRLDPAIARWCTELTTVGWFATDVALRVSAWNRWMEIHTRVAAAAAVGRPLFDLFPDLRDRELDQHYRAALDGRVSALSHKLHGYVIRVKTTHPELGFAEMPQSATIGPLHDGGAVVGTVTTIEDVGDRIASEAELRRQIAAHDAARAAAESALSAKDEFLSTLSHELRQPLNAVLGWTHLMMARKDVDPAMFARGLQAIDRNAAAQASLIEDILDVSRIVTGKLRLEMASIDLAQIVMAAVDVATPSAQAKGNAIRTALDPRTPRVRGEARRLQQIVWNLLSNAVKFTDGGGAIQVTLEPSEDHARLVVGDTGRGIAPDFLPFVFDRFRQGDASATRSQGGLGLGLALVRDLVSLHGGTIRAESGGDQRGSTFTILLPRDASSELSNTG